MGADNSGAAAVSCEPCLCCGRSSRQVRDGAGRQQVTEMLQRAASHGSDGEPVSGSKKDSSGGGSAQPSGGGSAQPSGGGSAQPSDGGAPAGAQQSFIAAVARAALQQQVAPPPKLTWSGLCARRQAVLRACQVACPCALRRGALFFSACSLAARLAAGCPGCLLCPPGVLLRVAVQSCSRGYCAAGPGRPALLPLGRRRRRMRACWRGGCPRRCGTWTAPRRPSRQARRRWACGLCFACLAGGGRGPACQERCVLLGVVYTHPKPERCRGGVPSRGAE